MWSPKSERAEKLPEEKYAVWWKSQSLPCLNNKVTGHRSESSLSVAVSEKFQKQGEASGLAGKEQRLNKANQMLLSFIQETCAENLPDANHCARGWAHRRIWNNLNFSDVYILINADI